jgi:hypothetical protein
MIKFILMSWQYQCQSAAAKTPQVLSDEAKIYGGFVVRCNCI